MISMENWYTDQAGAGEYVAGKVMTGRGINGGKKQMGDRWSKFTISGLAGWRRAFQGTPGPPIIG